MAVDMALYIKKAVNMEWDKASVGDIVKRASSGDPTFGIDVPAEKAVKTFCENLDVPVAFFTEDMGLVKLSSDPQILFVVDPIDGTRPAACGMPCCMVSVAVLPYKENAKFKDVEAGCIVSIREDLIISAQKNKGAEIFLDGRKINPIKAVVKDYNNIFWSLGLVGRPSKLVVEVLGDLIDATSVKGGVFVLNSCTYSTSRLLLGRFHAWVDIGNRLYKEFPELEFYFKKIGGGKPLGLFPHDLAAVWLILKEAGFFVSDAFGNSWEDISLTDHSSYNITSSICSGDKSLYDYLLEKVERGIKRLRDKVLAFIVNDI